MSSTASSSIIITITSGRCGLYRTELKKFNTVDKQFWIAVLPDGFTKCAAAATGWSPRLVGVELNPGPCQGAISEGKCEQGCTLTPKEVKEFKPDGNCDCGHSYLRHGTLSAQSPVSSEIVAKLEKVAEKTISEALSKFQTPQKKGKAEVRSTEKQKSLLRRLRKRNPDQVCDICGKGYPGMIGAHVVPWALRDVFEEYYDNQPENVQQLLPTSSFHESNGLILCPTCDKAFELHEINIEPDGRITVAPARRSSFPKLHNSHVMWSSFIDRDLRFPTSELLKYRKTLPKATNWIGKRALGLIPFTRDEGKKRQKREQEDDEAEKEEKEQEKQEEVDITALKTAGFSDVEISSLRSALSAEQLHHATRASKDPMPQRGRPMRRDRYVQQMEKQGWELSLDTGAVLYFFHPDTCRVWVRLRGG